MPSLDTGTISNDNKINLNLENRKDWGAKKCAVKQWPKSRL